MRLGLEKEGLLSKGRADASFPIWTDTFLRSQAVHLCRGDVVSSEPSAHDTPLVIVSLEESYPGPL